MAIEMPITRYADFFEAVTELPKKKYRWQLFIGPAMIPSAARHQRVPAAAIYWQSSSTSLWSPLSVVAQVLFRAPANQKDWLPTPMAGKYLGLSDDMVHELIAAQLELKDHLPRLRARLLEACGLEELAHSKR